MSVWQAGLWSTRPGRWIAGACAAMALLAPLPADALLQTDNDRTPTWTTFRVHAQGPHERGAFFGLGASCQFPEQFAPKRVNPRWESERPLRPHFVEHLNPAFSGCVLKPYMVLPEFMDRQVPAMLTFEFEKSVPKGFLPYATGPRQAVVRSNLAEQQGRRFALPDLSDAQDQAVTVSFSVFDKRLTTIGLRIDRNYTLEFHEYRRVTDDRAPRLIRDWSNR